MANWQLNPETWDFIDEPASRPRPGGYTWQEFRQQERPPCPTCGAPIDVEPVRVPDFSGGEALYIPGGLACPNGHGPR